MSRVYNERNRRPFKFTQEQYAQMRRLIAEYGWSLRGLDVQYLGAGRHMDNYDLPENVLVPTVLVESDRKFNWDHDRTVEARNSQFSLTMPKPTLNGTYRFIPPESSRKILT